ncbi:Enzymatic Polyprotein [Phytophthora cinnamomi]|uniref:Enzymatic Polyprotein n=1 Tax=Phytophthora cinnamomi TaxID=4785 RepID=UPI003559A7A5|nr:Enzymatic Polyprotein [Phytophthora cinnamomi]
MTRSLQHRAQDDPNYGNDDTGGEVKCTGPRIRNYDGVGAKVDNNGDDDSGEYRHGDPDSCDDGDAITTRNGDTWKKATCICADNATKKPTARAQANTWTANTAAMSAKDGTTVTDHANSAKATTDGSNGMNDDLENVPEDDYTLQLSDDELVEAQKRSKFVRKLLTDGMYGSMKIDESTAW